MVTELNMWDCNFSSVNHSLTWWESWTALEIKLSSSLQSLPFLLPLSLPFLPHQFPQQFLETPLLLQLLFLPLLHHPLWLLQILPSHLWKARRNISHLLHCFRLVPSPNSTEASIPAPFISIHLDDSQPKLHDSSNWFLDESSNISRTSKVIDKITQPVYSKFQGEGNILEVF